MRRLMIIPAAPATGPLLKSLSQASMAGVVSQLPGDLQDQSPSSPRMGMEMVKDRIQAQKGEPHNIERSAK